jgi:membrane complex biogenesis BtpA family protein
MENGADGLIIENTHDVPYQRSRVDASTIAACARAASEIRRHFHCALGLNLLAADTVAAVDTAIACDLQFVRCEGFVFAHVADEGIIQGDAASILRRRAHLQASSLEVWADVKKKHASHSITQDLSIREFARGAAFFEADAVIVSGAVTGEAPDIEDVRSVKGLGIPVVVGSGVTTDNIQAFAALADVLIVGSACKASGDWRGDVAADRVERLTKLLRAGEG